MTLKGKGIDKVVLSKDKIIALSKSGKIYGFPISKQAQHTGGKPTESSWVPGMSSSSAISYRHLEPSLSYSEKVTDIAAGRDHILILTSKGRVFSSAAASTYPNRGQMGIPGLIYSTRPADKPYDTAHEITALQGHTIKQIAAGDFHSVVLDDKGQVYTFGDNIHGQLGFEYHPETNIVDVPTPLPLSTIYPKGVEPKAAKIAAGGMNSYFIVDVNEAGRSSVDVLSCGTGIHGNLGNGRWKHIQGTPEKIKALSGLFEYNETIQKTQPIRLRDLSVGATHAAAVVANNTNIKAAGTSSSDVNYGADVLWWGNNEHYQLGTGKRNNASVPVYIQPLDGVPAGLENSKFTGSSSRGAISDRHSRIIGGVGNENSGIGAMGPPQVHRFQATPPGKVKGNGNAEQTVVCGRGNTAVYMKKV